MPLDTSSYALALLRLDGRRWNELRRIHGQISTQAAADGSSYFEMGNTKVICTVSGPEEGRRGGGGGSAGDQAQIQVDINIAGFSGVDRKRRARGDKYALHWLDYIVSISLIHLLSRRTTEMQTVVAEAFVSNLFTHLYPHSTIYVSLHVLSQDGSLLAACINAATLALIDAGIPMSDYIAACTAGSTATYGANDENADPLLDLNGMEEQELPFLTVGTVGATEEVSVLVMETRVQIQRVESMLAVGVDGCKQVKKILDQVVRAHGKGVLQKAL
jgi:exosome complex component RRP41